MAEQHPEPAAPMPPSAAPSGYLPPDQAAPSPGVSAPSFTPPVTAPVTGYAPPAATAPASSPAAPAAYSAPTTYSAPPAYAAPAPTTPAPVAGEAAVWSTPPTTPVTEWTQPVDDTPEQVGRGLLYAVAGVIAGIVLAIFLWQLGFVAALTGAVLAYACVWLYTKGAGRSPGKGAIALLGLIVVGVLLSMIGMVASDAVIVARKVFASDPGLQAAAVVRYLTNPGFWSGHASSLVMYVLFAGLGSFSIFVGLARAKQAG